MRVVALHTTASGKSSDRVVFKRERTGDIRMASYTSVFQRFRLQAIGSRRVDRMAVAAVHASFWNGMVRVLAEGRQFGLMAVVAELGLICPKHRIRFFRRCEDIAAHDSAFA